MTGYDEPEAALAVLGGEALHEITHTVSFLRLLAQQAAELPAAEVARFAQGELDRMQRLAGHLRRFKLPPLQLEEVRLRPVIADCIDRARRPLEARGIQAENAVSADCVVQADVQCLGAALRSLVHAAGEQTPAGSQLRMTVAASEREPVQLELVAETSEQTEPTQAELHWRELWPLGTPAAHRLIAHKLLRHMGWSLTEEHEPTRTRFRLTAPPRRPPP